MEIIKKKICLEDFKSRIPSLIEGIDSDIHENGSWGKIPYSIILNNKTIKYKTAIILYYEILDIILNTTYYEYDSRGKKWIIKDFDYQDILDNKNNFSYKTQLPTNDLIDKMVIGLITNDKLNSFYSKPSKLVSMSNYNGFDYIEDISPLIGRINIPHTYECKDCGYKQIGKIDTCPNCSSKKIISYHETFVPYFIYLTDVPDLISFMEDLKQKTLTNCCDKKRYEEYGGDLFLNFLKDLEEKGWDYYIGVIPTIDIPILITSDIDDFGIYETCEGERTETNNNTSTIIITSEESKLKTLRKRKISVDDNGNELPFILEKDKNGDYITKLPYQENYIKNIQIINGEYYGDLIVSMKEKEVSVEFIYVLGGRLYEVNGKLSLDEVNPFNLYEDEYEAWNGKGIWYKESIPMKKNCVNDFLIDGKKISLTYDEIDFKKKEIEYSYEGIDFPRKNYILCEDVRYKSDSYINSAGGDFIFKNEKTCTISYPLKEEYDVVVDRGSSAAFEKHLQLTEIKTWQDLENYRNGSLLNN